VKGPISTESSSLSLYTSGASSSLTTSATSAITLRMARHALSMRQRYLTLDLVLLLRIQAQTPSVLCSHGCTRQAESAAWFAARLLPAASGASVRAGSE